MFRQTDKDEELKRLEQELLETEERPPVAEVYRNYSNNYGRGQEDTIRNDNRADIDPETDSEEAQPEGRGVVVFALILATAAVVLVAALLIRYGGIF